MSPGENELAQLIGELSIKNARLLNELQKQEMAVMKAHQEREQAIEVLTKAQRTKLGLDLNPE